MTIPTPAVAGTIDAVRGHSAGKPVEVIPDSAGGVFVIVSDIEVGARYTPTVTWLGFQVNAAYPASDVYPHYTGRLARTGGRAHGQAIQQVTWQGRDALELSRRASRWKPGRGHRRTQGREGDQMARHPVNPPACGWSLTLPPSMWARLATHLFRADRDEHGAVILAGQAPGLRGPRLLGRELITLRTDSCLTKFTFDPDRPCGDVRKHQPVTPRTAQYRLNSMTSR